MTPKQPPAFSVRADELNVDDFIVIPSFAPAPRPIIVRVVSIHNCGDDMDITTTGGSFITSEGNLITCLGRVLEFR